MSRAKRQPSIVVIGAGMTGILLYIKLNQAGIEDVTIFEKKASVGGTWRENTYPGLTCDIPAAFYSYSFEPKSDWTHTFASGRELNDYFQGVSDKHGVTENIHFNEEVIEADFDGKKWQVKTSRGRELTADFIFAATGILHRPMKPPIQGLESFAGDCFHSAEWDHSVDLEGKRVGVVGTGSTSVQICSELISRGIDLTIFQRTAQWVLNVPNPKHGPLKRALMKWFPYANSIARASSEFWITQGLTKALLKQGNRYKILKWFCEQNLNSVKDPELKRKLTPNYNVGCKRIIVSDRFYTEVQKPNAHLITEKIDRIEPEGVRTDDGRLHKLDVLVLATGFDASAFMRPMGVRQRTGRTIDQVWTDKLSNYRSMFIPGFPNFFLMLGPNCPVGNFSLTYISEIQTDYCLKLIDMWRAGEVESIDAKPEAAKAFMEYIKDGLGATVWTSGCNSWYLDGEGDPVLWPYTINTWKRQMATPDLADFNLMSERHTGQTT